MAITKYAVRGMTCGGCRGALENALNRANIALTAGGVSLKEGSVSVYEAVDVGSLRAAVEAAGFELGTRLDQAQTDEQSEPRR